MPETFKAITGWFTTSGVKILGILIIAILSRMPRKTVTERDRAFIPTMRKADRLASIS